MSGRACSVCSRPDRPELDAAIVAGESKRGIARRFAVSPDAVERHARAHVGGALVRAAARKGERLEESLLAKVERLETDARRLGEKAESEGDLRCALAAVRELLDVVRLLHELMPAQDAPDIRVVFSFPPNPQKGPAEAVARAAVLQRDTQDAV